MPTSYNMRVKPITKAKQSPESSQIRDSFETPRYAVDLLIPFIPKDIIRIWECAAGNGRISNVLLRNHFYVSESDIRLIGHVSKTHNFLSDGLGEHQLSWIEQKKSFAIVTNPPFSIKDLFIEKAFEYGVPFAFLINADYSGQQIDWIKRGCEKIIPTRRINYLTPNILRRIHEGEVWKVAKENLPNISSFKDFVEFNRNLTDAESICNWSAYKEIHNYTTVESVPQKLLHKYSSSQFHSMWLTWGFNLGRTETFVDLPISEVKGSIL
jgi:hypothetical protein